MQEKDEPAKRQNPHPNGLGQEWKQSGALQYPTNS